MPDNSKSQPTTFPWVGTIVPWSAALHGHPSKTSRTLADLPRGASVKVIHRVLGWLYVEWNLEGRKSLKGYVSRELIKPVSPANVAIAALKPQADDPLIARQGAVGSKFAQPITIAVTSSYDRMEGIAHKLEIILLSPSVLVMQPQTVMLQIQVSSAQAVEFAYGPFLRGHYRVVITPEPLPGQTLGPKPLSDQPGDGFIGGGFTQDVEVGFIPPRIDLQITRKQSILYNIPVKFHVAANPKADGSEPSRELAGSSHVSRHAKLIEAEAAKQGVDPDLVKAIMYMETTHGWYDAPLAWADRNKSILPMNLNVVYWNEFGYTREQLKQAGLNIEAGVKMLRRLSDRVTPPTVDGIATCYNDLGESRVNDYGARVKAIYDGRLWEKQ